MDKELKFITVPLDTYVSEFV